MADERAAAGAVGGAFLRLHAGRAFPLRHHRPHRRPRRLRVSCLLAALGTAAFGLAAHGAVTGALLQALAGAGLAGTYMPGLKALTDRVEGPRQSRYIAFYTATFGIGTTLSLLAAGTLGQRLSWQAAIALLAAGPTPPRTDPLPRPRPPSSRGRPPRPVVAAFRPGTGAARNPRLHRRLRGALLGAFRPAFMDGRLHRLRLCRVAGAAGSRPPKRRP